MEDLPGWGICSTPGPPPTQHEHERRYTTRHTDSHSNKANMKWWLWRPNDIRGPCGPKVSRYLSYWWGKTSRRKPFRPGIEPGPAAWQARMLYLETNLNVLSSSKRHATCPIPFQTTNTLTKDFEWQDLLEKEMRCCHIYWLSLHIFSEFLSVIN